MEAWNNLSKLLKQPWICVFLLSSYPDVLACSKAASFRGVYLYPDLTHAIEGTFLADGRLQSGGHFGAVAAVSCDDNGILVPSVELTRCEGASCMYDPSTAFRISQTPFTRDLYEQQTVYVAQSREDVRGFQPTACLP